MACLCVRVPVCPRNDIYCDLPDTRQDQSLFNTRVNARVFCFFPFPISGAKHTQAQAVVAGRNLPCVCSPLTDPSCFRSLRARKRDSRNWAHSSLFFFLLLPLFAIIPLSHPISSLSFLCPHWNHSTNSTRTIRTRTQTAPHHQPRKRIKISAV